MNSCILHGPFKIQEVRLGTHYIFLIFGFFLSSLTAHLAFGQDTTTAAQQDQDTIKGQEEKHGAGIDFGFDGRRSFVFGKGAALPIKVGGVKIGIEIDNRFRSGIGFYGWKKSEHGLVINRGTPDEKEVSAHIGFSYASLYYEYAWLQTNQWELSTPLQIGIGSVNASYTDDSDSTVTVMNASPGVLVLSLVGHYKFFTWMGIGGGVGYRFMLTKQSLVSQTFSAPLYLIKLKVFLSPIFNAIFRPDRMERTEGCLGCYFGCFSF